MVGKFEDQYFDQLRAIEQAINSSFRQNPDLVDFQVDKVLESLVREYTAEVNVKRAPTLRLKPEEMRVYEQVKTACNLHLGRDPQVQIGEDAITTEEMIDCLKRIRRSVSQMGGKGRQSYLEFIDNFFAD